MHDVDSDSLDPVDRDGWPKSVRSRAELDAALAKGRESGRSKLSIPQAVAQAKARLDSSGRR